MRLPGTRYQEHGWEHVRKLLGQCSLQALASLCHRLVDPVQRQACLDAYVDAMAELLHAGRRAARATVPGNSYGDSALELALELVCELHARPADWAAFQQAVESGHAHCAAFWNAPGGEAILRKKVNDMFAVLRDKVDSDNYKVACGRSCSPNKMYAYRMLDTASSEIARLFGAWTDNLEQVAAILGRPLEGMPIEVRQMRGSGDCKAAWVLRWSESLECFGGAPGPLHTRSKRFANLKNSPEKIQAMLAEIGEYEELSSNRDCGRALDANEATEWLDDLWRVVAESRANDDQDEEAAQPVSEAALDAAGWTAQALAGSSLPVYLAVYLKMVGGADDTYPDEWLDPTTGELPTMQQLAMQDHVSLPTLRKRRDQAIARLMGAARP